ncbi:MAG TPA: 30S ribosome-binding factor RbfA [Acidimicrobiales bacterium]|jgi:ribosome-binding factor A|nr:30S ribosome-binding factor RbfA [Acidimicrobiales bacterium]
MTSRGRRYPRTARLNEVIREIIAEALEQLVDRDERLELVTITGVDADQDLRHATVFFTSRHEGADVALEEHRTKLQAEINRQARFRRTPQLAFVEDPGVSSGWRIEGILRDLHEQEGRDGEDEAGA